MTNPTNATTRRARVTFKRQSADLRVFFDGEPIGRVEPILSKHPDFRWEYVPDWLGTNVDVPPFARCSYFGRTQADVQSSLRLALRRDRRWGVK